MKTLAVRAGVAFAMLATPSLALAQDDSSKPEITVGASVGLHDLGVDIDPADIDVDGFDLDDSAEIYGGFVAVDFPVGETLFVGGEGNLHLGSGPIDAEYGASARLGLRTEGGSKIYLRGGYQWVDLDVSGLTGLDRDLVDEFDLDTTGGDYLVGAGVEFPIGGLSLRANVDTIAFDTLRGTVGVGLRF
ncbi:MAG: hypothetical protein V2I39_11000 [Erythrobacter sp.]|jgi:hypothetical protein|nr:hypothetical protein [Erythrobacter sp.]